MHLLRYLAYLTLAAGVLFLVRVGSAISAELALEEVHIPAITTGILTSAFAIAGAIICVALSYLRHPSRKIAHRLAIFSAASVCFLWPGFSTASGSSGGLIAAILIYCFIFRPTVGRAFRDDKKRA